MDFQLSDIATIGTVIASATGTVVALKMGLKNVNDKLHDLTDQVKKQNGRVTKLEDCQTRHIVEFHSTRNN